MSEHNPPAMTPREQLACKLDALSFETSYGDDDRNDVADAVVELRKVCRTCVHWNNGRGQQVGTHWSNGAGCEAGILARFMSDRDGIGPAKLYMPADGSGFCSLWAQRTAAPEGQ